MRHRPSRHSHPLSRGILLSKSRKRSNMMNRARRMRRARSLAKRLFDKLVGREASSPAAPVVAVHAAGHDWNLSGPKPSRAIPAFFDRLRARRRMRRARISCSPNLQSMELAIIPMPSSSGNHRRYALAKRSGRAVFSPFLLIGAAIHEHAPEQRPFAFARHRYVGTSTGAAF